MYNKYMSSIWTDCIRFAVQQKLKSTESSKHQWFSSMINSTITTSQPNPNEKFVSYDIDDLSRSENMTREMARDAEWRQETVAAEQILYYTGQREMYWYKIPHNKNFMCKLEEKKPERNQMNEARRVNAAAPSKHRVPISNNNKKKADKIINRLFSPFSWTYSLYVCDSD